VELDYLHDSEVCFNHSWIPFLDRGCGGDYPPTTIVKDPPLGGGFRGISPEVKFWEKLPCKIL
jgi:hypothetical protein